MRLDGPSKSADIWRFIIKAPDGKIVLLIGSGYLLCALIQIMAPNALLPNAGWEVVLTLMFMPVLLLAVFLRQRIGSEACDKRAAIFGLLSFPRNFVFQEVGYKPD